MSLSLSALNPKRFVLTMRQFENMTHLHAMLIVLEEEFLKGGGKPFVVTSGVRSLEDHYRIYREINEKRAAQKPPIPPLKVPLGSQHLQGAAVDLQDTKDQKLAKFCIENLELLQQLGLYMEDPKRTAHPNPWVHLQVAPPASGNRIFQP
jgi:hypothetical protein